MNSQKYSNTNENNFIYMKSISSKSIIWNSNVALRLLLFFLDNPTEEFYEKQIQQRTNFSLGAVNKHLKLLSSENYILLRKEGRMNFFRLNRENLVVKHLKIAHHLSSPLISTLIEMSNRLGIKLYLYGSVARGEDDTNSDWDLLVLGNVKVEEIERELSEIRERYRKKVRVSIFSVNEWLKMAEKDPAFYERVERDKIKLA